MQIFAVGFDPATLEHYSLNMYYVYVLLSDKNETIYIGYTTNVVRRLQEHNHGDTPSTKRYRPWKVIYVEGYFSQEDAKRREVTLKRYGRSYAQLKFRIKKSILDALR